MSDMADVLHTHARRSGIRGMAIHCDCGWSESILAMRSSKQAFAAHQAAALSAAGFGQVQEARSHGYQDGYSKGYQSGYAEGAALTDGYKVGHNHGFVKGLEHARAAAERGDRV